MSELKALLKVGDIAKELCVSPARIYQLLSSGDLPSVRIGGAIRIPRAAWDAWLLEQKERAMDSMRREPERATASGPSEKREASHA